MLVVKYKGLDADRHRIDALTGGESLSGIGHALTLISHYASTGNVRFRAPYSKLIRFYYVSNQEGSLEWLLDAVSKTQSAIALGLRPSEITSIVNYVFSRAIGRDSSSLDEVNGLENHIGDLDALVEAVEPSLRKAHRAIGSTAHSIAIYDQKSPTDSIVFDRRSKNYLDDDINAGTITQDVSIPALNVNSRYDRAYLEDQGRTIPFKVSRDATGRTMTQLSKALDDYAKKNGTTVSITFEKIESSDERIKRLIIYDAKHLDSEDI